MKSPGAVIERIVEVAAFVVALLVLASALDRAAPPVATRTPSTPRDGGALRAAATRASLGSTKRHSVPVPVETSLTSGTSRSGLLGGSTAVATPVLHARLICSTTPRSSEPTAVPGLASPPRTPLRC